MNQTWIIGNKYIWKEKGAASQIVLLRSGPGPYGYRGIRRRPTMPPMPSGPLECEVEPVSGGTPFFVPAAELSPA